MFWMFLMIMMMLPWVAVAAILLRQPNFQDLSNRISVLSTSLMELRDECRATSSSSRDAMLQDLLTSLESRCLLTLVQAQDIISSLTSMVASGRPSHEYFPGRWSGLFKTELRRSLGQSRKLRTLLSRNGGIGSHLELDLHPSPLSRRLSLI